MHESRESPRLPQREQCMPVVRHNDKRAEINALLLFRKREGRDDDLSCGLVQNRLLRMK